MLLDTGFDLGWQGRSSRRRRGFTLVELIVVVIIIGILATIAIPQYLAAVERSKASKAYYALHLIVKAQEMFQDSNGYFMETPMFNICFDNGGKNLCQYIDLHALDNDKDWGYSTMLTTGAGYANRIRQGQVTNEQLILYQNGNWDGDYQYKPK